MGAWPALPYAQWKNTYETLHRWLQIAGKVRLVQSPWVNHQWHVTLLVTPRGLTTSAIPHGSRTFEIVFDFIDSALWIHASDGRSRTMMLEQQSVARFYRRLMSQLEDLELPVKINPKPNEVADATPFNQDEGRKFYDPDAAADFWRVLVQVDRVFKQFRGRFAGKCSPVHLFNGRRAPEHPGGAPNMPDRLLREAYSHECSSAGFWPGSESYPQPVFFSYAYPAPAGFSAAQVKPEGARFDSSLGEFVLPYDAVRESQDPDSTLLEFLQSTYEAAADLGGWDRAALEMKPPR